LNICIYPGSFDPITNGHLDIIKRSSQLFDKVIVGIIQNPNKNSFFTLEERIDLIKKATNSISNIEIDNFTGLLIDFAKKKNARVIIRGLRAISDFEYEFQMASMNHKLDPKIETVFMMTNIKYSYLSSSMVKEVGLLGGCIKDLVPEIINDDINRKLRK